MSVRRAQAEIDSHEFAEWMAYYRLEPFGEVIADMRHGVAVSVLANINRDPEKRPDPYEPRDFIYWHDQDKRQQRREILLQDKQEQSKLLKAALFGAVQKA